MEDTRRITSISLRDDRAQIRISNIPGVLTMPASYIEKMIKRSGTNVGKQIITSRTKDGVELNSLSECGGHTVLTFIRKPFRAEIVLKYRFNSDDEDRDEEEDEEEIVDVEFCGLRMPHILWTAEYDSNGYFTKPLHCKAFLCYPDMHNLQVMPIYKFPFPNIFSSSKICFSDTLPECNLQDAFTIIPATFFGSIFNQDTGVNMEGVSTERDLLDMYKKGRFLKPITPLILHNAFSEEFLRLQ